MAFSKNSYVVLHVGSIDPSLLRQQAYLNGIWWDADSGSRFSMTKRVTNPVIGSVPDMGASKTIRAILAARTAWPR